MLAIKVIQPNGNRIESLIIVPVDYGLLVNILHGPLMNGKILFFLMNLILRFLTEKIDHMYVVFHQNLINHLTLNHVFKVVAVQ
jgi:hypothetical protein